jgi:hypothetical protein
MENPTYKMDCCEARSASSSAVIVVEDVKTDQVECHVEKSPSEQISLGAYQKLCACRERESICECDKIRRPGNPRVETEQWHKCKTITFAICCFSLAAWVVVFIAIRHFELL